MGNMCKRCSSKDIAEEPLIRAIRKGSYNGVLKCLRLKERGSVNYALVEASFNANESILRLLAKTEDVNGRSSTGQTALLEVVASARTDSVQALLKVGADPNLRHGGTGDTPLIVASRNGFADIVSALLDFSADANCLSNDMSALMIACQMGFQDIVRLLIDSGKCDVELTNEQKENGLMLACSSGKLGVVLILINSGCKLDCVDANGRTALMKAAGGGHFEIVKLLVKNGAQVSTVDNFGRTAQAHLRMKYHDDTEVCIAELATQPDENGNTDNEASVNPDTDAGHVHGGNTFTRDVKTDGAICTNDGATLVAPVLSPRDTRGDKPAAVDVACVESQPFDAHCALQAPSLGAADNVARAENECDARQILVTAATIICDPNIDQCDSAHESDSVPELDFFVTNECDVDYTVPTQLAVSCGEGKTVMNNTLDKPDWQSCAAGPDRKYASHKHDSCENKTSIGSDTPSSGTGNTRTIRSPPIFGIRDTPSSDLCDSPTRSSTPASCKSDTLTSGICDTPTSDICETPTGSNTPTSGISDTTTTGIWETPTRSNTPTSGICQNPSGAICDPLTSDMFDTPTSDICDTPTENITPISCACDTPTIATTIDILDVTMDNNSTPDNPGNRTLLSPLGCGQGCDKNKVESLTPVHDPEIAPKVAKNQKPKENCIPWAKTFPRRRVPEWVKGEHGDGAEVNLNSPVDAHNYQGNVDDHTTNQEKCHSKKSKPNKCHKGCKTIIFTNVANIQNVNKISINGKDSESCNNSSTDSDQSSDENISY